MKVKQYNFYFLGPTRIYLSYVFQFKMKNQESHSSSRKLFVGVFNIV